ncbi:MAG: AAA family ATPase [Acidimicrobiales bacterium]
MRLSSFHVDGYGALADFGADDLAPGLVVLLGPNEAGKSTLFDFVTGVLFGFPSRKDNPKYRSPVRGGRHGGRVGFVDEAGAHWVVERHAGAQRDLVVRLPDGSSGDEHSLARALAGASASLFEAVFAVGLDDLGQMKNLQSDEVRELLFTASIFGQRRSATTAMKRLAESRDELARPRREEATANRLAAELEVVRGELAIARLEAGAFEALQRQESEIAQELRATRARLKGLRERDRQLQLLESCWQHYHRARTAAGELASLPPIGPAVTLIEYAGTVRELAGERSGHRERIEKLAELRRSQASLESSIDRRLPRVGSSWTRERALEAAAPDVLGESVRSARDRLSALRIDLASKDAVLAQADGLLTAIPLDDDSNDIPGRRELEARDHAVTELRDRLAESERLQLETLADERELALARVSSAPSVPANRSAVISLLVSGMAVCAVGAALFAGGHAVLAVLTLAVGLVLIATGGHMRRQARQHAAAPSASEAWAVATRGAESRRPSRTDPTSATREVQLERTLARTAELARQLGLPTPPSRVDLDRLAATLQRQWERRRQLDDLVTARAQAQARHLLAAEAVEGSRRRLSDEQASYGAWCASHGFDPTAQPDATLEAIAELAGVCQQLQGLERIERAIADLDPAVESFVRRCCALFEALDPALLTTHSTPGPSDGAADDLESMLTPLVLELDEALAAASTRMSLERERAAAERALESAIGGGRTAEAVRSQLVTGDVLSWARERSELEPAIEELTAAEEDAVRQHQSLAEEMRRLATSARIADLEQRYVALDFELDAALRQYLVLGTARGLLQRTLAQHERERQPAVVANAAAHFERVTAGRYVGLLADAGVDGRQTIRALSSSGEVIDAHRLSRGTIEQLYLCLRLGLADSFAERSVSLPIVLDDVLVNFDPERAAAVASELASAAETHQILLLTCHPHLAELVMRASGHLAQPAQLIRLGRLGQPGRGAEQLALAALTALPDLLQEDATGPRPATGRADPGLPTAAGG